MKKNYLALTIVGVVLIVAILTNPNQDRHKEAIKNRLTTQMQKSMKESLSKTDNGWEQVGQAIGLMLGNAIIDKVLDNFVSTDNYLVCSTTKITWNGETKIVGIGAFGNVFLTKELDKAMDEGLLKEK